MPGSTDNKRDVIPVPKSVSDLLVRLYRGFSLPEKLEATAVSQFQWAGKDFSSSAQDLCGSEGNLTVRCEATEAGSIPAELNIQSPDQPRNKSFQGQLSDGRPFWAEFAHVANEAWNIGGKERHEVFVQGAQWHVVPRGEVPSLWVGKLDGKIEEKTNGLIGNLRVSFDLDERTRTHRGGNLRLSGEYVYYLVGGTESWFLIVDTGTGEVPDRHKLWTDFLTMEFAIGKQMRMRMLHGIDGAGDIVAHTGGFYGEDYPHSQRQSPVPPRSRLDVPLFEAISRAWRQHPELRWGIALQSYLDSFTSNIEVAYLRLQVALESFAYWILKTRGELDHVLVEDVKKWEAWVKANEPVIRSHAKGGDAKLADALYLKVKKAYERSTGKLVRDAFSLFDLDTTKAMDAEIRSRDLSVHTMQMSPNGYELDRDVDRINTIRALLVALIAKAAGYQGAIADQELLDEGRWWTADPSARGQTFYSAEEPSKIKLDAQDPD